jgi:hypothetical protein
MTVIARDQVAADHLVYPWPLPVGVECEVTCGDDDIVVMCPAWLVGDQLGPGRHHWRTPDPSRPTAVYFVRQAPVEVAFDLATTFLLPTQSAATPPVRVRLLASGAVQISCADPSLLVAQFVGLPFDAVNDGILRSVSRSVERMLARLLTRRVVMASTPLAVTDPVMLPHIVEELIAYNPAAGAVFGIELMGVVRLAVSADDGVTPSRGHHQTAEWGRVGRNGSGEIAMPLPRRVGDDGEATAPDAALSATLGPDGKAAEPSAAHSQTIRHAAVPAPGSTPPVGVPVASASPAPKDNATPPLGVPANAVISASGEIVLRSSGLSLQPVKSSPTLSGVPPAPMPPPRPTPSEHALRNPDNEMTPPSRPTPRPPTPIGHAAVDAALVEAIQNAQHAPPQASGEFAMKVPPGTRVKIPGPDGLMQSATVRQLLQGYYELEVGSGETIWVPMAGVVPE